MRRNARLLQIMNLAQLYVCLRLFIHKSNCSHFLRVQQDVVAYLSHCNAVREEILESLKEEVCCCLNLLKCNNHSVRKIEIKKFKNFNNNLMSIVRKHSKF